MPDFSKAQNIDELIAMMWREKCDSCHKERLTLNCTVKGAYKQVNICRECLKENIDFYEVNK